jgi:centromeric protein E
MTVRTPGTPASKIDRTPVSTPGASKIDRTPVSTPGGPRAREEKIVVTVRLRPLNKREQLAKDQVAWDCIDDHTIVHKPPPQERSAQPASFTFGS